MFPSSLLMVLAQDTSGVSSSKRVYEFEEPLDVDFVNTNPQNGDWLGIYRRSMDPSQTTNDGALWKYTCGDQHENKCLQGRGRIRFSNNDGAEERWDLDWPLPPGEYQVYLLRLRRASSRPFQIIAEGNGFEILREGASVPDDESEDNDDNDSDQDDSSSSQEVGDLLEQARRRIIDIINDDIELGPKFVRLSFHDCVGGCDGCVEVHEEENFGLELPMDVLEDVVQDFARNGISRADIWALAAMTACQKAQPNNNDAIRFPMIHFGRRDCGSNPKDGPSRDIPDMNTGTRELFTFFEDEFGFDIEETVAIMGAHTLGRLATENSGVDGPSGWLLNPDDLDNEYYAELIGGDDPDDDLVDVLVNRAPAWSRALERNDDDEFPEDRRIWVGFPEDTKIVMVRIA